MGPQSRKLGDAGRPVVDRAILIVVLSGCDVVEGPALRADGVVRYTSNGNLELTLAVNVWRGFAVFPHS